MKPLQQTKVYNAIPPAAIKDDAAFVSRVIDTAELNYGEFHLLFGTIDADLAVCKIMESDEMTDATTLGGTPGEMVNVLTTEAPGDDDDNKVWIVAPDLRGEHKRYIQLQATAGNGAAGAYVAASFVAQTDGDSASDYVGRDVAKVIYG